MVIDELLRWTVMSLELVHVVLLMLLDKQLIFSTVLITAAKLDRWLILGVVELGDAAAGALLLLLDVEEELEIVVRDVGVILPLCSTTVLHLNSQLFIVRLRCLVDAYSWTILSLGHRLVVEAGLGARRFITSCAEVVRLIVTLRSLKLNNFTAHWLGQGHVARRVEVRHRRGRLLNSIWHKTVNMVLLRRQIAALGLGFEHTDRIVATLFAG